MTETTPPPPAASRRHAPGVYTRRRLLVAGGLGALAAVAGAGTSGLVRRDQADSAAPTSATSPTAATTATTSTTTPPASTSTEAPASSSDPDVFTAPLRFGSSGRAVTRLQDRLRELSFEPGPSDGQFGALTQMAVWAFEKLVAGTPAAQATGTVTDDLWQQIRTAEPIEPLRTHAAGQTSPDHTEVYLPEQVVAFFDDDRPVLISHMSSGSGQHWHQTVTIDPGEYRNEHGTTSIRIGLIGESITPGGVYLYDRIVTGRRLGALGAMHDPAYFNYGIAIHGADNIPLQPASHGCVRIPRYISERFHQFIDRADQVWVWDGHNQPEWLGQVPPPFDQVDPDWNG